MFYSVDRLSGYVMTLIMILFYSFEPITVTK